MPSILVKHSVSNFATWKKAFDEHAGLRKAAGCQGGRIFQDAGNPNDLTVVLHWDTVQKAQTFAQSPELKAAMEKAGVTSQPQIHFLNDAGQFSF